MLYNHSYFPISVLFHVLHSFLHSVFLSRIIHINTWICGLMFYFRFGKFSTIIFSNTASNTFSLFIPMELQLHIFYASCLICLLYSFLYFASVSLHALVCTFSTDPSSCSHLLLHLIHIKSLSYLSSSSIAFLKSVYLSVLEFPFNSLLRHLTL